MQEIRVYTPESLLKKPRLMMREMWRDLLQSRELALRLAVRDISAQYRQSFLGILWAFILPLANTFVWLFLKNTGIVALGDTPIPYPVYVFTGTMIWAIFIESMQAPLQKTIESKAMLSKINFPREAIIVSGVYQSLFNAGIKVILLVGALFFFGQYPDWHILLFPLGVLSIIMIGTVVGIFLTPIGLLYSDIGKSLPLLLQFLMYLTPVVYALPKTGWVAKVVSLNPMTPLLMTTRNWLTGFSSEFLIPFLWINLVFFVILFLVWVIYRAAMPILIERMSA